METSNLVNVGMDFVLAAEKNYRKGEENARVIFADFVRSAKKIKAHKFSSVNAWDFMSMQYAIKTPSELFEYFNDTFIFSETGHSIHEDHMQHVRDGMDTSSDGFGKSTNIPDASFAYYKKLQEIPVVSQRKLLLALKQWEILYHEKYPKFSWAVLSEKVKKFFI